MKQIIALLSIAIMTDRGIAQVNSQQADSLQRLLMQQRTEDSTKVNLLIALGSTLMYSDPYRAISYTDEALQIAQNIKWQPGIFRSYRQKGVISSNVLSNHVQGLDYYLKALNAAKGLNNKRFDASMFLNIGLVNVELSKFDEALKNLHNALEIYSKLPDRYNEAITLMNIGLAYFRNKQPSLALDYYSKSLVIAEPNNYDQIAAYALSNKGAALDMSEQYRQAIEAFKKSITYADKTGDKRIKAQSLGGLCEAWLSLKQYDTAEKFGFQSLALSREIGNLQSERDATQMISDIYLKKNKPLQALDYFKEFIALKDSIMNADKKSEITRIILQYQFDKQQDSTKAEYSKQQTLSSAKIERQRTVNNSIMGGAGALLLAGATSFLFYKKRRDAVLQKHNAEFRAQVADTEMKALRAQMNPHFIFNSLNSIGDYISKNDTQSADYYLAKFAKVMRMILENSEQKEISLSDDLSALELYMQLEALRLNHKFSYEIKVDEQIDPEATLIPPLILQPFVENSIWHGIAQKTGKGKIVIEVKKEGEMINCIVTDDGVGKASTAEVARDNMNIAKKSLGMKITKARIDILNKLKQTRAAVTLPEVQEGTRVEVRLPLELSY